MMTMREAINAFNDQFQSSFEFTSDCFMAGGNVRVVSVACPSNQYHLKNALKHRLSKIFGNHVVVIAHKGEKE